jgi:hypothetical protein
VKPYPPGSWGPTEIGALISPHSWRLPFARRWREAPARAADGNGAGAAAREHT